MLLTRIDTVHEYDEFGDDITGDITGRLFEELNHRINLDSRFKAKLTRLPRKNNGAIKIARIRLKESKIYCGSHPAACERGGSHRKGNTLEGADWVEFNDLVNNICDSLWIYANISTSVCKIRRGYERRIEYGMHYDGFQNQWNRDAPDEHWDNYCGRQAPWSEFPYGTPGIYSSINYKVVG